MAENTKIAWADHTFNPWIGCTKVSAGCDNCYAENRSNRFGDVEWGHGKPRRRTSKANWKKPLQWDWRMTERRQRVFCASLADVFDTEVPDEWRRDLFTLIEDTWNLDWLLLTKRPEVMKRWFQDGVDHRYWLGTTVEDQSVASRIPSLIQSDAVIRFLSVEPMIGPVFIDPAWAHQIHWVICGGESGNNARPFNPDWAKSLRDQCAELGIPFFMKQMGGRTKTELEAIPDDLMIRQFPTPAGGAV